MIVFSNDDVKKNILRNCLLFANSLHEKAFESNFVLSEARGNLTEFQPSGRPTIIIDLAPDFNIPQNKTYLRDEILNYIISEANIYPYMTYVYKDPLIKKSKIDESEACYDVINYASQELEYIIELAYRKYTDITMIFLGKYIEYKYLMNILNYKLQSSNKNLQLIYNKHISGFIKEKNSDYKTNKILKDDINRISKKLII